MTEDLVFYTHPMSRGQIIRWMLEEVGEPYNTQILDYATTMKAPEYLGINPMGKVPAIKHGGQVVTECAAICAYLADAFPDATLAPPMDSPFRAPYYRWLFFGAGPVEAAMTNRAAGFEVAPERERMMGYGNFEKTMDAVEAALDSGGYLVDGRFSAADLYLGSQVAWGMQFGSIPPRPTFDAYVARLQERPAFQRAKAIDAQLIAEMHAA